MAAALLPELAAQGTTPLERLPAAPRSAAAAEAHRAKTYGNLPLQFEENQGQANAATRYLTRGSGYSILLQPDAATFVLGKRGGKAAGTGLHAAADRVVRMTLAAGDPRATMTAQRPMKGYVNYMTGPDRSKWRLGVPTFGESRVLSVYPGIDLVYYGNQRKMEYDFLVAPGTDPCSIRLRIAGATPVLAADGHLTLQEGAGTSADDLQFEAPILYQEAGGKRQHVNGAFAVARNGEVSFRVGAYDHGRELVIDPVVSYASYFGGTAEDEINGSALNGNNELYAVGQTFSPTLPSATGEFQASRATGKNGNYHDAFVTKFSADGSAIEWTTYLSGNTDDFATAVAVNASDQAYVVGYTNSCGAGGTTPNTAGEFPFTSGAVQKLCSPDLIGFNNYESNGGSYDAFLVKLSPDGKSELYGTPLGGSANDFASGVALDGAGNVYIVGETTSTQYRYSANGNGDIPNYPINNHGAAGVGTANYPTTTSAFYTNTTESKQYATTDGGGNMTGPQDEQAFLTVLSPDLSSIVYSSLIGGGVIGGCGNGACNTNGLAVAVNLNHNAFIGGNTSSAHWPVTAGAFSPTCANAGAARSQCNLTGWLAAFDATKSGAASLVFSTYVNGQTAGTSSGGTSLFPASDVFGLATDSAGNVVVTGDTNATDFPTTAGVLQPSCFKSNDGSGNTGVCEFGGFVAKLSPAGSTLWSTYLGATAADGAPTSGRGVALDSANNIFILAASSSSLLPTKDAFATRANGTDAYLAELSPNASTLLLGTYFGAGGGISVDNNSLHVDSSGGVYFSGSQGYNSYGGTSLPVTPNAPEKVLQGNADGFVAKIATGPQVSPPATPITGNLLQNPGAEAGSIANWTPGGQTSPTVDAGTFDPSITPHTGTYDFLGQSGAANSLSQTVQLLTQGVTAATLDNGNTYAALSFWEQGLNQGTPSDDASVTLTFSNSDGGVLGTVNSGEIDSHNGTWMNFAQSYPLPPGTRSITYTMNFVRHAGSDLHAFVDDNSLRLSTSSALILSARTLDFGSVMVGGASAAQVVTATNRSGVTINFAQIALQAGANPSDFVETDNCPAALPADASCQITIVFKPHAVGAKSAGLDIQDDSIPSLLGVDVTGIGTGGILQVNPGNLKTIAGNGTAGNTGDGGPAPLAELKQPNGIAFDPQGNLYLADDLAAVVRKVDTAGNITTFAGVGTAGFSGDGGPATRAQLNQPFSVASDAAGNIYIQDTGNDRIRKVTPAGIISTFAGTGTAGHAGDGGPATAARFNQNQGARFDHAGNLFVPQCGGPSVRRIDATGIITTVAGNFTPGFSGDGGAATSAQLQCPSAVAIDAAGNFYIADEFNQRIRKVDTQGKITTIAGDGNAGLSGDGGAAAASELNLPNDVALDAAGNLYIADSGNNRIRRIDTRGIITTVAGGLQNAGSAAVNTPLGLTVDASGNLFFSDSGNSAVRELFPSGTGPFPATPVGTTAAPQTLTLSDIGNLPVTLAGGTSFTLGGNSGDFALTGGSCLQGATLNSNGGACTLQIAFTPVAAGLRTLTVSVVDSALNSPQTFTVAGTGTAGTPTVLWAAPSPIVYGTPLAAAQLNATATGAGGVALQGAFAYTPAAGTILGAGTQTLRVVFTPASTSYGAAAGSVTIDVTPATSTIAWPTPASISYGTPLSAAQLDATVTGIGTEVPQGTLTYSPPTGTVLTPGMHTLSVAFTPAEGGNYTAAMGTVQIAVSGLTLTTLSPNTARLDDPDKVITLTGSGFVASSIVQVNGASVATTYVNPTTLTAVVPAANFVRLGTLQVAVSDPGIEATSSALPLTVVNANPTITLTGPPMAQPGSQPALAFTLTNPYPINLIASFNLTFASAVTPAVDDPAIQFSNGGRNDTFIVPANSVTVPPILIQAGTVAGTITVPLTLTAGGVDVTPANLRPVVIVIPPAVPVVASAAIARDTGQLTVTVNGFSNTREIVQAHFHFVAAAGAKLDTTDLTVSTAGPLFTGWFTSAGSTGYGSTFTYTQNFNISGDPASVAGVQVTLTNSVGESMPQTTQ